MNKTAFLVALLYSTALSAVERPNVLLIMVDDLRPMLGCYGEPRIQTPNIDRLARRSVVFDRAYCQYAKCGTSRLSLMTGLRPDSIGVFSNRDKDVHAFRKRRPDAVALPKWLREHGYFTRSFGKIDHDGWHNNEDWSMPASPGRDREMWEIVDSDNPTAPTTIAERLDCPAIQSPPVSDEHLYAGRMTTQVIEALGLHSSQKPVFFAIGYRRPHLPFVAPKKYFDQYQPNESWLAPNPKPNHSAPIMAWFNSDGYVGSARKIGLTMPTEPNRRQAIDWNGYELRSYKGVPNHGPIDRNLQLKILQAYAACVSYVDVQVGRILDELVKSKMIDNTIVIFTSDHGWHLGEQSAWGKMTNFEVATRVPLLIAAPNLEPARTNSISELVDLYPTVCELADIPTPKHIQGESLASILGEPQKVGDEFAISQYSRFKGQFMGRAIRTDHFRYVAWTNQKSNAIVHQELYDHQIDPLESENAIDDPKYSADVERLGKQLSID